MIHPEKFSMLRPLCTGDPVPDVDEYSNSWLIILNPQPGSLWDLSVAWKWDDYASFYLGPNGWMIDARILYGGYSCNLIEVLDGFVKWKLQEYGTNI